MRYSIASLILVCLLCGLNAQSTIDIDRSADASRRVPIALKGFSGEVAEVLTFDLEIQGFVVVPEGESQMILKGDNQGRVSGELVEVQSGASILPPRAYKGAPMRHQAHAMADYIVEGVFPGQKGISTTKIAFKVDLGRNNEICVAEYDGHDPRKITNDNTLAFSPAWAPGGKKIYYTSYQLRNPDIYSHDLTTGERKVVARYSGSNLSPAVSPDGRRVAMVLSKGGSPDLYVAFADGTSLKRLTSTRAEESSPCWSPDGRTICFVSSRDGRPALFMIDVDGGEMRKVRTAGVLNATEPDWSPDGKTLVFTTQRGGGFELCSVPVSGGAVEVLVRGEDPSWAPNSRTVIFTRRGKTKRYLSLLDVQTKHVKDMSQLSGSCSQPTWAR